MRRPLPRLALLALLALTPLILHAAAFAQEESIRLDAIRDRISLRIEFEESRNGVPRTKDEKRCQKAFERAERIIEKGAAALPAEAKALKKIAVALNRWFGAEPDTARAFAESADAIDSKLVLDFNGLTNLIGSVTPEQRDALKKKDLKKLQRFLDQVDKKRTKAAAAAEAGNQKKQASQLFGAAKAGAKAVALGLKMFPDPQPPAGNGEFLGVTTGIDLSGVSQAYSVFAFPEDPTAAPVERQLSTGTTDVSQVRSITSIDKPCAFWMQGGDLFCSRAGDPDSVGINLTTTVPPLVDEPYAVSPSGNDVVVRIEDGTAYAVDVATGSSFPVGPARRAGTWFENGTRPGLVLESSTFVLTIYELDATSVTATIPLADEGNSVTASTDGRFITYAGPPPFGGGQSCYVFDRTTSETIELSDRLVTMDSGGDFSCSEQIAAVWANATTCFIASAIGLRAAVYDAAAGELAFDITVVDPSGRDYAVCDVNSVDALIADVGEREIVHTDLATFRALFFPANEPRVACAYDAGTRQVLFAKTAPDGAPEAYLYSCATGEQEFVFRPETDASKFSGTFVRNCDLAPAGDDVLISFNVVGNNDLVAGLYQGLLTRPLDPDPATLGPVRVAGQEPETSIEAVAVAVSLLVSDQILRTSFYVVRRDFSAGVTEGLVGSTTLRPTGPEPGPAPKRVISNALFLPTCGGSLTF